LLVPANLGARPGFGFHESLPNPRGPFSPKALNALENVVRQRSVEPLVRFDEVGEADQAKLALIFRLEVPDSSFE
jgi:hypothetical protein